MGSKTRRLQTAQALVRNLCNRLAEVGEIPTVSTRLQDVASGSFAKLPCDAGRDVGVPEASERTIVKDARVNIEETSEKQCVGV